MSAFSVSAALLVPRLALAAVLAWSGAARLADRRGFREALAGFALPAGLARAAAPGTSHALVMRETSVSPRQLWCAARQGKRPADSRRISPARAAVVPGLLPEGSTSANQPALWS